LTVAHAAEKVRDGGRRRSRMPTDDRSKFKAGRLPAMVTNWHCRPAAGIEGKTCCCSNRSFAVSLGARWPILPMKSRDKNRAARWRIMDAVYDGTESCKLAITEQWMTAPCQPMAVSVADGNGVIGRDV